MTTDLHQHVPSTSHDPASQTFAENPASLTSAKRLPPIVAVVSPKGGSGKTVIATNLALAFAQRTPTVLMDLDLYSGDVEWAFGVQPDYRLHDVARRLREDRSTELEGMFTMHDERLSLLCSPDSHIATDGVLPSDVGTITKRLIALNRPLVIDTNPGMSDFTLDSMELASHVLLITTPDIAPVQAASKLLDTMAAVHLDTNRVALVVNRSTSRTGLSARDAESRLGMHAILNVPESRMLAAGFNSGYPLVETHPDSRIAGDLTEYAERVMGLQPTKRSTQWWRPFA